MANFSLLDLRLSCDHHMIENLLTRQKKNRVPENIEMADKLPPALKGIQPFMAISKQFTKRDPIISYYGKD